MNDILRGTSRIQIMNSLLAPAHRKGKDIGSVRPDVQVGVRITESRLDDEQSVAVIEFSDTPLWLQDLSDDPYGFPKHTKFGTLWKGVDKGAVDEHGRSEFMTAVMNGGHTNLVYAEMLAEFNDTDVNIQDSQGRTALHWASVRKHADMVRLCLSVPECQIGLKDNDGLTAFDISNQVAHGNELVPNLFYTNILEIQESHPQAALLRVLTVTSEPDKNTSTFPGVAMFGPVEDRNEPLIQALINRGIDLTAKNELGDTALHVALTKVDNTEIVTRLLEAGSDVNAIGNAGATPLHYAAQTSDKSTVELLLAWEADITAKDGDEKSVLHWAAQKGSIDVARLLLDHGVDVAARDISGQTAQDLAEKDEKEDLVGILKEVAGMKGQIVRDLLAVKKQDVVSP